MAGRHLRGHARHQRRTVRFVNRLEAASRYNRDLLAKCTARPWDLLVRSDPRAVSIAMPVIAPVPPEEAVREVRPCNARPH